MLRKTLQKVVAKLLVGALAVSCVPAVSDASAHRPSVIRNDVLASTSSLPADDNFNIIAEPFEWGLDVTRIMLKADASYNASDVKAGDFTVYGEHYSEQAYKNDSAGERKVVNAYPVDSQGNKADDGMYIVLELEYGKNIQAGHLGSYSYANYYTPLTPRNYKITWSKNNSTYTQNDKTNVVKLVIDEFRLERHIDNSVEDKQYNFVDYAFYSPKEDGRKKPLIIFFHGMGEGGTRDLKNQGVQMYAYQEEAFAEKEIQDIMGGGAYVLLPQSPDRWPTNGFTEETAYLQVVKNLIDTVIAENKDIDTNRIYIGGLSMGGFMACRMIINYPEMFAAAFPCSQAYAITESDAEKLKDLPVWVSCSEVDGTCAMDPYTYASYVKLKEAGNKDARCAVVKSNRSDPACRMEFYTPESDDPVLYEIKSDEGRENTKTGDLTFNNDTYGGHEAGWVLLFNNREYYIDEDGKEVTAMEWVASQSLVSTLKLDTSKVKTSYKTGETFTAEGLAVTAVMRDGTTQNVTDYTISAVDTSKTGDVTVMVEYSGKSASFTIKVADARTDQAQTAAPAAAAVTPAPVVTAAPAVTVKLSDSKVTLAKKGANKYKLTADVGNSTDAVVWTSSDSKVAAVDSRGVITAKSAGKAVIKATVAGVSAECKVIVKKITFKAAKKNITVKKGKTAKIKVTVAPKNKVSYKTSSGKIARVTSKGVVKGIKKGTAAITITCQGIKLTVRVRVK